MRSVFQEELDGVSQSLVDLSNMASDAIHSATQALIEADLKIAEEVISYDEKIDLYQHDLDTRIIDIIARQQPVASDLRALVTALRMSADLERMGDLAHHVAKVARLRHPANVLPAELKDLVNHIGSVAENISRKIPTVIETRDIEMALQLEKDDDEMDKLHRQLIGTMTNSSWTHGIESAVDITLLGRYYERFADHAVSVSRRVYFLVTGTFANPTR
ncbi:phosphate transport system protein [Candidatus Planktophila versatilis]|nr:phosphate transport system protein [Candidatus Planktophila versatilis]